MQKTRHKIKYKDNYNPENIYQEDFDKYIHKKSLHRFIKDNPDIVDFEKEYKKQQERLEEAETERFIREKRINGVYRTKTTKAGNQLEIDIYPSFQFAIDVPKENKGGTTSPAQKNLNNKRAQRYLVALINCNFEQGDYWCTWTYSDENIPGDMKRAQRDMVNFIKRIKTYRKRKKLGEFKYLYITEYDEEVSKKTGKKKTRVHHHMLCTGDMNRNDLEKIWKKGKRNRTRIIEPDSDTHLAGMGNYITKDPKGKKRWSSSMNLTKPTVTKSYSKFKKRAVEKMVKQYDELEWQITKQYPEYKFVDAEVNINKVNGGFYIYARMVRKE